jgi:hypothetical protein
MRRRRKGRRAITNNGEEHKRKRKRMRSRKRAMKIKRRFLPVVLGLKRIVVDLCHNYAYDVYVDLIFKHLCLCLLIRMSDKQCYKCIGNGFLKKLAKFTYLGRH